MCQLTVAVKKKSGSKVLCHLAHHEVDLSPHLDSSLCDQQTDRAEVMPRWQRKAWNSQLRGTISMGYPCFTFMARHAPDKDPGR